MTLVETAVRPPVPRRNAGEAELQRLTRTADGASGRVVEVRGEDGDPQHAWWILPRNPAVGAVIVLHGIGDTRMGATGHAGYLLSAGHAVLLPDLRGHGSSSGNLVSYGLLEAKDLAAWVRWVQGENHGPVHAIGVSMGAAVVLQALPEVQFASVVAESSFSCFDDIAQHRLRQFFPGSIVPMLAFRNVVLAVAYPYARLRTGLSLKDACPAEALLRDEGRTPVLLVHGMSDTNIPPSHSRRLASLPRVSVYLWEVPDAGHVQVLHKAGAEYRERVLRWFSAHGRTAQTAGRE